MLRMLLCLGQQAVVPLAVQAVGRCRVMLHLLPYKYMVEVVVPEAVVAVVMEVFLIRKVAVAQVVVVIPQSLLMLLQVPHSLIVLLRVDVVEIMGATLVMVIAEVQEAILVSQVWMN